MSLLGLSAHGQWDLDFNLPAVGGVNVGDIGASGGVNFGYDLVNDVSTIDLSIKNTSVDTTWSQSYITGFYILKPWGDQDLTVTLDASDVLPRTWGLVDGKDGNIGDLSGVPFIGNKDDYLYFGSSITENPEINGLEQGGWFNTNEYADFAFSIDGSVLDGFNPIAYYGSQGTQPHLVVRWQAILYGGSGDPNDYFVDDSYDPSGSSAKGYTYFTIPGTIIIVPEPSEIAAMALLGIGFLLWARNRFLGKKRS